MTKLDINYSLTVWIKQSDFPQIQAITVTGGGNGNGFLVRYQGLLADERKGAEL